MEPVIIYPKAELPKVVAAFLNQRLLATPPPVVLALHGELGAGKTTFVQELARQLGVAETVTSPTFTIMKSYSTEHPLVTGLIHIDAYRFESLDEARPLFLPQVLATPGAVVCVEWASRIASLLPPHTLHLTFSVVSDTERSLTLEVPSAS